MTMGVSSRDSAVNGHTDFGDGGKGSNGGPGTHQEATHDVANDEKERLRQ